MRLKGNIFTSFYINNLSTILFLYTAFCLIISWVLFSEEIFPEDGSNSLRRLFDYSADALIILLPFWFFRQPKNGIIYSIIIVFFNTLWLIFSLWNFRFWGDILGLESLSLIKNVNGILIQSIPAVWKFNDLLYLIIFLSDLLLFFILRHQLKNSQKYTISTKIIAITTTILLFFGSQYYRSISLSKYYYSVYGEKTGPFEISSNRINNKFKNSTYLFQNGQTIFFYKSILSSFENKRSIRELSPSEKSYVNNFVNSKRHEVPSISKENIGKNVILIIVESLNANVIDQICNNRYICPNLRTLVQSPGSICCLNINTQVKSGGSGDGQFITNTGLLPLDNISTSIVYGDKNKFISLVYNLDKKSNTVIFADDGSSWNERNTFLNYGFKKVITRLYYTQDILHIQGDAAMFKMAEETIPTLESPFFLELLTESMHVPFDISIAPNPENYSWITNRNPTKERYLKTVNYFDNCLGKFIDYLIEEKIWDNTLLIIASDHSQSIAESFDEKSSIRETPMCFIAANTGYSFKINYPVNQIDIYPTILDIAGSDSQTKCWYGVGTSILKEYKFNDSINHDNTLRHSEFNYKSEYEKENKISELIIKSDYFRLRNK